MRVEYNMDTPNYAGLIASLVIGVATIGGLGYLVVRNEDDESSRDNSQHDENSNENEEEISQDEDTRVFQTPKKHRKSVKNSNKSRRKSQSRRTPYTF